MSLGKKEKTGKDANTEIGVPRKKMSVEKHPSCEQPSDDGVDSSTPVAPYWHSRGYLPHFESPDATQHVTVHLADSMAAEVLERFEDELKALPEDQRDQQRRERIEEWLDAGHGSCILGEPPIADMVQNSLLHFDDQRYHLLAWVVMPNHVHALFEPINGWTMKKIDASWKKYTATRIHDLSRRSLLPAVDGGVWHREYWDRYIRNERHFQAVVEYIHNNPVKAGLVKSAEEWPWSSAARVRG